MVRRDPQLEDDELLASTRVQGHRREAARPNPDAVETLAHIPGPAARSGSGMLPVGAMVDHFEVLRLLGCGAMGEVYLARDTQLGRKVALKIIQPRLLGSVDALERFMTEARVLARFDHPHIVPIYAVGQHGGRPYLALAYLRGQDLRARCRERSPTVRETLRFGIAIADALQEAHRHRVLHRDLKPANVVIGEDGRLRVVDFGLAKALPGGDGTRSAGLGTPLSPQGDVVAPDLLEVKSSTSSAGAGTPGYMAPEQWREEECTPAADLWALGVILFELCAGWRPFQADDWAPLAIMVTNPEPAPHIADSAQVPAALAELIDQCLRKDAAGRPSAADVARDLRAVLGTRRALSADAESPFRGLFSFDERHAALFFGREAEIEAFVERARTVPVLPVVGRSGTGKTSFIQAGVIPRLREQGRWVVVHTRPGSQPFRALAAQLVRGDGESASGHTGRRREQSHPSAVETVPVGGREAEGGTIGQPPPARGSDASAVGRAEAQALAEELFEQPQQLSLRLRLLAQEAGAQVLLVVDQLEELFTLVGDETVRRRFVRAICLAADDASDPVRVVLAVRDDFLGRLATDPETSDALARITVLRALDGDALAEILQRPVEAVDYHYEDPQLLEEMVEAVRGSPAPLPLLQFAAQRLWELRDSQRRLLLRDAYERIGGVGGALIRHADGVLDELSPAELELARQMLLRLVTPERTRKVISRQATLHGLVGGESSGGRSDPPVDAAPVLARLAAARLISISRARGEGKGHAAVELAHESLIHAWSTLARWVDETEDELGFVAEAEQAADLWDRRGRRPDELWQKAALDEALRSADRCSTPLPRQVEEFLAASRQRELRRQRGRRRALAGAIVVLAAIALIAILVAVVIADREKVARTERDRAEQREAVARERTAEALREAARAALSQDRMLEARAKLRGALELARRPSTAARAVWWQLRRRPLLWSAQLGGSVLAVDVSPTGHAIAAGCEDEAVYLLDSRTREARVLRGHEDQVLTVAFAPDGATLASGDLAGDVRLWNLRGQAAPRVLRDHRSGVRTLEYRPDGRLLATGNIAGGIQLWNGQTGEQLRALAGHDAAVVTLRFSPDGRRLASAGVDGTVRLWVVESGAEQAIGRGHVGAVLGVAYSPDGRLVASSGNDHTVRLWRAEDGSPVGVLRGHEDSVMTVEFSPDGERLVTGSSDSDVRLWDVRTQRTSQVLRGHAGALWGVAFGPQGKTIASGSADRTLRFWSAAGHTTEAAQGGHEAAVRDVHFHPDGKVIASGSLDETVRLWDVTIGEPIRLVAGHAGAVYAVAFSPDGATLASGGADDNVRLWDPATGRPQGMFAGHAGSVRTVTFSPDGATLVSGSADSDLRLWSLRGSEPPRVFSGHRAVVRRARFDRQGARLASVGMDSAIRLWDVPTGKAERVFRGGGGDIEGVSFSPDGKTLATAGQRGVHLWDLTDGTSHPIAGLKARPIAVQFAPAGERLAGAGSDGTAWIWDRRSRSMIDLMGHRGDVGSITFSPDGTLVATASGDTTVRLWYAEDGRPYWRAPVLHGSPPRLLTHRGWQRLDGASAPAKTANGAGAPPSWGPNVRQALEQTTRYACDPFVCGAGPRQDLLCAQTHDNRLQLWDLNADVVKAERSVPGLVQVVALTQGCAARSGDTALVLTEGGETIPLAVDGAPTALAAARGSILVAAGTDVYVFGDDGQLQARRPAGRQVTTVAFAPVGHEPSGDAGPEHAVQERDLVVGLADGAIALLPGGNGTAQAGPLRVLERAPGSAPLRILEGPRGTLLVGHATGVVSILSSVDGKELVRARLHGRVVHLSLIAQQLVAATDLGQFLRWDLDSFYQNDCELIREVWAQVPIVWHHGRAVLREPAPDHPCRLAGDLAP